MFCHAYGHSINAEKAECDATTLKRPMRLPTASGPAKLWRMALY